jgi:hypothetical protein
MRAAGFDLIQGRGIELVAESCREVLRDGEGTVEVLCTKWTFSALGAAVLVAWKHAVRAEVVTAVCLYRVAVRLLAERAIRWNQRSLSCLAPRCWVPSSQDPRGEGALSL